MLHADGQSHLGGGHLIDWVANSSQVDQLAAALGNGRVAKRRRYGTIAHQSPCG
jgi:hypothetical protein